MIYNFDDLQFKILTVKQDIHPEGYYKVKGRPFASLSLKLSGGGVFVASGKQLKTNVGDVLFIPSDVSYEATYLPSESIIVHFSECNYKIFENITLNYSQLLQKHFFDLLENWKLYHSEHYAKSLIYKMLYLMQQQKKSPAKDDIFEACKKHIEENFCNCDFSVTNLAKFVNISEATLRRKFHTCCGISPKVYLLNLRLEKALNLFISGTYSLKQVAELCGFADEKYFSRVIKNKYGCSPSALHKKF